MNFKTTPKMRLRMWKLSFGFLLVSVMSPVLFWAALRVYEYLGVSLKSYFLLYQSQFWFWGCAYGIFSALWIFFMKRGFYSVRWAVYGLFGVEFLFESISAVWVRDLSRLGIALVFLILFRFLLSHLEKRITSAALSPDVRWFEDSPKTYPSVNVEVGVHDGWIQAGIRNIDQNGLFLIFREPLNASSLNQLKKNFPLRIRFHQRELEGIGVPQSCFMGERWGIGLQFSTKELYHFNQYTALVEELRARGLKFEV